MSHRFFVSVGKDRLMFSASHFITYAGGECERLHGHNYRVGVELEGPLGEGRYVVDFEALREVLWGLLAPWDHRVLLPTAHPLIRVADGDAEVEVVYGQRRWVFPRSDCTLLPLANTTAELLAQHLAEALLAQLDRRFGLRPRRLDVEVEESPGLSAHYQWQP
ncbi:MAG: 6-pyruvoyl tetrahydropterin synthase family protein [Planctomycetes bacterium]|nr:6-pyruvoyl tetrahydropterin synthase family protein [Planctomycetota bacterium]